MHPRAVTCHICNRKFFPESLKFHVKVCAKKLEHIDLPCRFCKRILPRPVLQVHLRSCRLPGARDRKGTHSVLATKKFDPCVSEKQLNCGFDKGKLSSGLQDHSLNSKSEVNHASVDAKETTPREDCTCSVCGRKFAADRVDKHQRICNNVNGTGKTIRRKFDSSVQRLQGLHCEGYPFRVSQWEGNGGNWHKNWRAKHEDVMRFVRETRRLRRHILQNGSSWGCTGILKEASGCAGGIKDFCIPCPFCRRTFAPTVAHRHIPKCKLTVHRPKAPSLAGSPPFPLWSKASLTAWALGDKTDACLERPKTCHLLGSRLSGERRPSTTTEIGRKEGGLTPKLHPAMGAAGAGTPATLISQGPLVGCNSTGWSPIKRQAKATQSSCAGRRTANLIGGEGAKKSGNRGAKFRTAFVTSTVPRVASEGCIGWPVVAREACGGGGLLIKYPTKFVRT